MRYYVNRDELSILIDKILNKFDITQKLLSELLDVDFVAVYRWRNKINSIDYNNYLLLEYIYSLDEDEFINYISKQRKFVSQALRIKDDKLQNILNRKHTYINSILTGIILSKTEKE